MKITFTSSEHDLAVPLARHLLQRGHTLQLLSTTSEAPVFWQEHMHIAQCDFQDSDTLKHVLQGQDTVLNLHAPVNLIEDSVSQSLNIFHGALQNDARVIHFSNHEVYGVPMSVPISEQHPLMGKNHFTQTCIATDMLAKSFYQSFQFPVIVLRLFPVFEDEQLLSFLEQLHSETGSENPYFDFLRMGDVNDCVDLLLNAPVYSGETFNLASGRLLSQRLLQKMYAPYAALRVASQAASKDLAKAYASAQIKDWDGRQGDNEALKNFVPWQVRHTTPEALKIWLRLYCA